MDANVLLAQIGRGNLMGCGARDFVVDGAQLMFRVGSGRKLAKIIVTLVNDEYTVRYVEMNRRTYELTVDETVDGVGDHNVGAIVRRMGDRP